MAFYVRYSDQFFYTRTLLTLYPFPDLYLWPGTRTCIQSPVLTLQHWNLVDERILEYFFAFITLLPCPSTSAFQTGSILWNIYTIKGLIASPQIYLHLTSYIGLNLSVGCALIDIHSNNHTPHWLASDNLHRELCFQLRSQLHTGCPSNLPGAILAYNAGYCDCVLEVALVSFKLEVGLKLVQLGQFVLSGVRLESL